MLLRMTVAKEMRVVMVVREMTVMVVTMG